MTALPHTLPARTTRALRRVGFTFADDGSYAACLASAPDGGWHPEVWRLGTGVPEPHTLALPDGRWESLRSQLLALPDGRVLVCRHQEDRHEVVVLSRTDGDGAGEGGSVAVEQPVAELYAPGLRLLPLPAAAGPGPVAVALATATTDRQGPVTTAWLIFADDGTGPGSGPGGLGGPSGLAGPVAGLPAGPRGPQRVAEIPGLYGGGLWLDTGGRMLALDRVLEDRVKSVVVDLAEGTVSPLLEITPESNDRLALADPATGLIVLRSDAPGTDRLGWGILGENVPVRFPECLNQPGAVLHPVAVEPPGTGADPSAEGGGAGPGRGSAEPRVAVQIDRGTGSRLALWQPSTGRLQAVPVPPGRLGGVGHWSASGLRMPYSAPEHPAAVATVQADLLRGAAELPPVSVPAPLPLRLAPLSPDTPGRPTAPHAAPRLPTTTSVGELPGQRLAALSGPGAGQAPGQPPGLAPDNAGPGALTPGGPSAVPPVPPMPPMPPLPPPPVGTDTTGAAPAPAAPAAPGGPAPGRPGGGW
ncbi:hypothetical protein [Phaeacidiphilus oryzae]|uniref:hypothetical protein n=1 Tax=Phaeacidiphilus oryzae TaxID=348818 RepID=UPI0006908170|nr:hypothetical protein [Phaeacidiphilus oryzae]